MLRLDDSDLITMEKFRPFCLHFFLLKNCLIEFLDKHNFEQPSVFMSFGKKEFKALLK